MAKDEAAPAAEVVTESVATLTKEDRIGQAIDLWLIECVDSGEAWALRSASAKSARLKETILNILKEI
mgnify:CR=1 FL=1